MAGGYDGRGSAFPLTIVDGADMAFQLTATTDAGVAIDLSAATIAGELYNAAGTVVDTFTAAVSGAGSNVVTLSLTDTETAALSGVKRWTLWVTRGGDKRPWLAGPATVVDGTRGRSATTGNFTLEVDTDVNVAVNVLAVSTGIDPDILTTNGDMLTRAAGVPARITRADLAADPAFAAEYASLDSDEFVEETQIPYRTATPAPYYRSYVPAFRDTFGGGVARWVPQTNTTGAEDTTYFSAAGIDKRENGAWTATAGKSLKLTKGTASVNGKFIATMSVPLNVTGHHPVMRFYVHAGTGASSPSTINAVYLFLFDGDGDFVYFADVGTGQSSNPFRAGWRTRSWRLDSPTAETGTFNPANITSMQIWVQTSAPNGVLTDTPSVTFDWLDFVPQLATPVPYIIGFDGSYSNHRDALAYMAARGMKGTVYATYDDLGGAGRMSIDDLRNAEHMGHYVDVHERNASPTGWWAMTATQKQQSILEANAWKRDNGFTQGGGFATLATQWYADEDTLGTLYPFLDHVRIGQPDNQVFWNPRIIGVAWDTNGMSSASDEVTHRTQAKTQGTVCSGVVHDLTGAFDLADFKTMIDNIAADTDVRVVTPHDLLSENWYA